MTCRYGSFTNAFKKIYINPNVKIAIVRLSKLKCPPNRAFLVREKSKTVKTYLRSTAVDSFCRFVDRAKNEVRNHAVGIKAKVV